MQYWFNFTITNGLFSPSVSVIFVLLLGYWIPMTLVLKCLVDKSIRRQKLNPQLSWQPSHLLGKTLKCSLVSGDNAINAWSLISVVSAEHLPKLAVYYNWIGPTVLVCSYGSEGKQVQFWNKNPTVPLQGFCRTKGAGAAAPVASWYFHNALAT